MIVAGDWLLPGDGQPLQGGAVLLRGPRIQEVAPYEALVAAHPGEPVDVHAGCVITPGLVNAHTHLSLTVLRDLAPPGDLATWLRSVAKGISAMRDDEFAASATLGALESLEAGVTVVGDIAYGPEAPAACGDAGLAGTYYWEVLGIEAADLSRELARREFPSGPGQCTSGRTRRGLTPHAPYTAGPELLRAVHSEARRLEAGFAVHVAESLAERQLLAGGAGPFQETAARFARGFTPPRTSSVAYLDALGVLEGALAIHCVHLGEGDAALLGAKARAVVLCPRSNAVLGNGRPPVSALAAAGVALALGTDSAASNADLDILAEARALAAIAPQMTARRLMRMMTIEGAAALGLDDELGSLEAGKQADLAVFRVGETREPEEAVIRAGGRETLKAVMSGGAWRMRECRHVFPTQAAERAADRARSVAQRAIDGP